MRKVFCSISLTAAAVLLSAAASCTARAQLSVYGAISGTDYGLSNGNNFNTPGDTFGLTGGAFYNLRWASRLKVGVDARGTGSFNGEGGDAFLVAGRINFVPSRVRVRPYFQAGGGRVSTRQRAGIANGAVELAGGLDVPMSRRLDLRAFELGAAVDGNSDRNTYRAGFGFINIGLVYRLGR